MSGNAPANDASIQDLFPDLADTLAAWRDMGGGGPNGIPTNEHGGVTDEDVAAYMARIGRAPLPPLVSSQQPPPAPEFQSGQGSHVPPAGGVEPPQTGGAGDGSSAPPAGGPVPQQQTPPQQVIPPAQSAPPAPQADAPHLPPPPAQQVPQQPPGAPQQSQITAEQIAAYAQFDELMRNDPGLGEAIANYLGQRAAGGGARAAVPPPAAPPYMPQPVQPFPGQPPAPVSPVTPQFPQFVAPGQPQGWQPSAEDLAADPVLAGMWQMVTQQQQVLNQVAAAQQEQARIAAAQQQAEYDRQMQEATTQLNAAVTSYQQSHNLTEEQIARIRQTPATLGTFQNLIAAGTAVPDAVNQALDIAFWADPELRAAAIAIQATQQQDQQRRRHLAGSVSGSNGSVPRTQPIPTDPAGKRSALLAEVGDMMRGEWSPPTS